MRSDKCPACGVPTWKGRFCDPCFRARLNAKPAPEDLKHIGAEVTREPCQGCGIILTREQRLESAKAGFPYLQPVCSECREATAVLPCNVCGEPVDQDTWENARGRGYTHPICVACGEREGVSL